MEPSPSALSPAEDADGRPVDPDDVQRPRGNEPFQDGTRWTGTAT